MSSKKGDLAVVLTESVPFVSMLQKLKEQLKGIETRTGSSYKGKTTLNLESGSVNIETITDATTLANIVGTAIGQEELYNKAQEVLEAKEFPIFRLGGATLEDIIYNCKLRLQIINSADEKKRLEDLIKEGEQFISKDEQKQMWLEKMSGAVSGSTAFLAE